MNEFVRRSTLVSSRRFLGDVRRELMQLREAMLILALLGTLGSYLRDDAVYKGSADAVAFAVSLLPHPADLERPRDLPCHPRICELLVHVHRT
jgi:hypothetical protein